MLRDWGINNIYITDQAYLTSMICKQHQMQKRLIWLFCSSWADVNAGFIWWSNRSHFFIKQREIFILHGTEMEKVLVFFSKVELLCGVDLLGENFSFLMSDLHNFHFIQLSWHSASKKVKKKWDLETSFPNVQKVPNNHTCTIVLISCKDAFRIALTCTHL